ncbi:mucin-1 [Indicator indicator]|uniref:mucin-1 n=1 Tax=Indicator indicator TaxID=1002788 RepID=UPI0023DE6E89|nr:mucin-1 [Indicator indicator]
MFTTETTTETTTDTETTTSETTTVETTLRTTLPPVTTAPNFISKNTAGNGTQTSVSSHTPGNTSANSTVAPAPGITASSNTTTNSSSLPPAGTSSPNTNGNGSARVVPTEQTSGSTAPRLTPTAVLDNSQGPNPSKAAVLPPTAGQLLLRVPLSFRILNRSFNESLRDPTSKEYQSLQYSVLSMFERVFGCVGCMGRQTYKGCSELQFSQGSVLVQSTLVFGHGNGTASSSAAEQQLRSSLDPNGFIMDLQLADIQSAVEVMSPAPVPVVPDWAIALLVLTTCTCRRKSRGKLDLSNKKDSYHPMAEYPPYQSHGRYAPPNSKPSPYSQVASSNGAGTGTFTYTNPAAGSDNL